MATNVEESTLPSRRKEQIAEQARQHFQVGKQAFADYDYPAAVQAVEQVPEHLRTAEMKELHRHCLQLKNAQLKYESAERSFANGDYQQVVRSLERIRSADFTATACVPPAKHYDEASCWRGSAADAESKRQRVTLLPATKISGTGS